MNELSVYIHWPFCKSKCPYCDFMSVPEHSHDVYSEIEKCLLIDLQQSMQEIGFPKINTVFFGGGTPSLMSPLAVENILNFLQKHCEISEDVEITLEANPATFSKEKIQAFKSAGINRLSIGIQSFQDKNLKFLGRIYDSHQALAAVEIVSDVFDNFSFDFMYGYQIQSAKDIENDLRAAMNFNCPHISCYQLTFEENTTFFAKLEDGELNEIDESDAISHFDFIEQFLCGYSINRYEVSNYAKVGFESKHNLVYWNYKNYLGIGPSAHSRLTIDNQKYERAKVRNVNQWKNDVCSGCSAYEINEKLSETEQLEEILLMGLRLTDGINAQRIIEQFSEEIAAPVLQKIQLLRADGFFAQDQSRLKLTPKGFLALNSMLGEIFEEKAH